MAYTDNTSSQISAQNVGIKISQPGINAVTASPTQLIFDSSWPSMAVIFNIIVTPTGSSNFQTIPHNLGFPPFIKVWVLDSNYNPVQNTPYFYSSFAVDSTNIYIYEVGVYQYIELYNVDLSVDVDYPTLPYVSGLTGYDNNYGIKIAKENKSATSKNPRDFILHSKYRSPLVKAVKTEKTANPANFKVGSFYTSNVVQYTNQDGVATWNYGFIHCGNPIDSTSWPYGSYAYAPYFPQNPRLTFTNGITTTIQYFYNAYFGNDLGATIVILRDPLLTNNIVGATY